MADKQTALDIVLRTVDNATAGIRAFKQRVEKATAPFREKAASFIATKLAAPVLLVGMAAASLGKEAGVGKLAAALGKVGKAAGVARSRLKTLWEGTKEATALVGISLAGTAAGLGSLISHYDDLGDASERLGVSVDGLTQLRYAAARAGASVEAMDSGLQTLTENLGQARANTGRMTAFLQQVSPALLRQMKTAKNTEAAFMLLANAMAKIKDPAKRAALAQKTLGDSKLAPLLAKGAKGIQELRETYLRLAGPQQEAADGAGAVDDAMHDLHASTDGLKAVIVAGLSPALKEIVQSLTEWFVGHREDVKRWAIEFGEKLPGALKTLGGWVASTVTTVAEIVEMFGGLKVIAIAVAAAIAGPLVGSLISLAVAMMTTPVGWLIAGVAAISAAVYELVKHWDSVVKAMKEAIGLGDKPVWIMAWLDPLQKQHEQVAATLGPIADPSAALRQAGGLPSLPAALDPAAALRSAGALGPALSPAAAMRRDALAAGKPPEASVKVDFTNLPRGARVVADRPSGLKLDMRLGYQMGMGS